MLRGIVLPADTKKCRLFSRPQTTEADIAFEISLYLIHSLGSQRRRVPGWENIPSLSCSFSVTSITTSQIWHPCGTAQTSCVHLLLQFSPSIYGLTLRWYAIVLFVCYCNGLLCAQALRICPFDVSVSIEVGCVDENVLFSSGEWFGWWSKLTHRRVQSLCDRYRHEP